jgi:hypothetical protein
MIIQPEFLTHWKVQALSGAIGRAEALTSLLALFGHCQTSKSYVHRFSPEKLPGICQYHGDPDHLLRTFLKLELLDLLDDGEYEVHGWAEKNASYKAAWANGAKGGTKKNPSATPNASQGIPSATPNNPMGNPSATHRVPIGPPCEEKEEKRKEKKRRKEPCLPARRLP